MRTLKNKSMIKQIFVLGVFASILLMPQSCTDGILDQVNTNAVSTGNFWQDAADAELAVNGMYHPLTNTFFWGRIVHTGAILRSDAFNIRPFGTNTSMSTFQGEPGVARWATEPFQEPYKAIFRANAILENVNADNIPDAGVRNGILGQAFFIRAFAHFYLVKLFGNVPLVTQTAQSGEDFFPNQASPADVYAQIEADFAMAADLLPSSWSGNDLGRATSGAASGYLGKARLYQGRWAEAEAAFRDVVNSNVYSLLPAERYAENFGFTNENNEESLFEFQYQGLASFSWGVDVPGVGTLGTYHIDYAAPFESPDQSHYINQWVLDVFERNGDVVRRNATLAFDFPGSTGYGGLPFLRYSDVLLMLAEALNNQGNTAEALTFVNQVRQRAQIDPLADLSQSEAALAIIDERVMELTGEGHRFFDLVRWELADDFLGANSLHGDHPKSLSNGVFQSGKHELVWIPTSELNSNPNMQQNPGY